MPLDLTEQPALEQRVDRLLVGAIDPHVHSGPSIAPRSLDHLELVREASKAGFAAVVTKDHDYSGVMTAALISKNFPELTTKIYSSIVLNNVIGGFNAYAVEHTAAMGGKIVWMPTLAAEKPPALGKGVRLGASGHDQQDPAGDGHSGARQRPGGARRGQGSSRRHRPHGHDPGQRPSACERNLARLRGSAAGAASSAWS